jgi:DNA-binding transcriptional regulator YhcF (GntR family)
LPSCAMSFARLSVTRSCLQTSVSLSKLAMFLQILDQLHATKGESTSEIYLPMSRSNIAEYLGISLAALSRAFRALTARGVVQSRDRRRHVKVIDRSSFAPVPDAQLLRSIQPAAVPNPLGLACNEILKLRM